jgi:hypothetical protein
MMQKQILIKPCEVEMWASLVNERDTDRKKVHEAGFGFHITG